jgi:hypothetical protein
MMGRLLTTGFEHALRQRGYACSLKRSWCHVGWKPQRPKAQTSSASAAVLVLANTLYPP